VVHLLKEMVVCVQEIIPGAQTRPEDLPADLLAPKELHPDKEIITAAASPSRRHFATIAM
jgi:hypothetical protein